MSNKSKGSQFEREAKAILEKEGWVVERAHAQYVPIGPGRMIAKSWDFFGAWDLICKKGGFKTMWVQVSTWANVSKKRAQVNGFPWTSEHDEPCIFARVAGRKRCFRVLYGRNGYEWLGDEYKIEKPARAK